MNAILLLLVVVLILVVGVFFAFISSAKKGNAPIKEEDFPSLSFDSQAYYRPIRSLKRQITEVVEKSEDPAIRAMSGSILQEVQDTHDRMVGALQTRDRLRKAMESHANVESEAQRLLDLRDKSESTSEKLNYTRAYESKSNELEEYKKGKVLVQKIEQEIELTKAKLSDLKSKLSMNYASADASARAEDLRSSMGSLDTLQTSMDEAQQLLNS